MQGSKSLCVSDIYVSYGGKAAVHGVSVKVRPSEVAAIIGANGAGKTTLLRGIMGLAAATAADLTYGSEQLLGRKTHQIASLGIGLVPEGRELFGGLTVIEELQIGARHLSSPKRDAKFDQAFTLFPKLHERRDQVARTMSGGEQQMLAIARILMREPTLLLLDEPSLGLAPVIQDTVYDALKTLRDEGIAMLLVEQNAFRALRLCNHAYVIELGKITREGSSQQLLNDPAVQAAYLGH